MSEQAFAALRSMSADVEALLINRTRGVRQHFLVPIDECYRLVGVVRTTWRGLSGGSSVWREVDALFASLGALPVPDEHLVVSERDAGAGSPGSPTRCPARRPRNARWPRGNRTNVLGESPLLEAPT